MYVFIYVFVKFSIRLFVRWWWWWQKCESFLEFLSALLTYDIYCVLSAPCTFSTIYFECKMFLDFLAPFCYYFGTMFCTFKRIFSIWWLKCKGFLSFPCITIHNLHYHFVCLLYAWLCLYVVIMTKVQEFLSALTTNIN